MSGDVSPRLYIVLRSVSGKVCQIPAYLFGMSDPGGVEPAPHTRNYNKLYINTSSNRLLYERLSLLIRYLNKTDKDLFLYIYNYKK
jgi:hypothetical protein